jgi:hypothetical protein
MNTHLHVATFLAVSILALGLFGSVRAQGSQRAVQPFYDSTVFGIRIQANATAQAQPMENVTIVLTLTFQAESYGKDSNVSITYLNVSIFGFLNGTDSILMSNKSDNDFSLSSTSPSRSYNWTFPVPEWVSGMTYGEVRLTNSIELGLVTIHNDGFVCGFYMTNVENVYLARLEHDFSDLTQNCDQLNKTCAELQQNLTALQGNTNELFSTREVAAVLGVTTVVFVVTTMYLMMRKPKQYW